jgi:hypothetical protein
MLHNSIYGPSHNISYFKMIRLGYRPDDIFTKISDGSYKMNRHILGLFKTKDPSMNKFLNTFMYQFIKISVPLIAKNKLGKGSQVSVGVFPFV